MAEIPVGILGGTFDPVHYAHLRLAEEALERLPLGVIRWVPSGFPGHRGAPVASAADRVGMLRLALGGHPRFQIDIADAFAEQPVFTINTLKRLRAEFGASAPLVLIIGADQFHLLHTWRDWRMLFELAHVAVAERPGYAIEAASLPPEVAAELGRRGAGPARIADGPGGGIIAFPLTAIDISATAIREAVAAGRSVRYLLPDSVLAHIASNRLYLKETKITR